MYFTCPACSQSFRYALHKTLKRIVCAFLLMLCAKANAQVYNETVKSLFVFSFTKYIDWPYIKTGGSFTIGVAGSKNIYTLLSRSAPGKKVQDLAVNIIHVSTAQEAAECQLVFIGHDEEQKIRDFADALKEKPVLIVTEDQPSDVKDIGINIFEQDKKIKFKLFEDVIKKSGLKISSDLINLQSN